MTEDFKKANKATSEIIEACIKNEKSKWKLLASMDEVGSALASCKKRLAVVAVLCAGSEPKARFDVVPYVQTDMHVFAIVDIRALPAHALMFWHLFLTSITRFIGVHNMLRIVCPILKFNAPTRQYSRTMLEFTLPVNSRSS